MSLLDNDRVSANYKALCLLIRSSSVVKWKRKVNLYLDHLFIPISAKAWPKHDTQRGKLCHESILTLYLPEFNMALVDVALVVLIDVLAKKVNENNNQILRGYCAFETPSIIALRDIKKCRKQTKTFRRYDIGPRPLYVSDHTPPRKLPKMSYGHAVVTQC